MSPPAVIYIRTDGNARQQRDTCVRACIDAGITNWYVAQGGDGALSDALGLVARGEASTLVVAHAKILGGHLDLVRSQVGEALRLARAGERVRRPRTADLAAKMARHGMTTSQIADVLGVDEPGARALLRSARIHKALSAVGLGAVHDKPSVALKTAALAVLILGVMVGAPHIQPYVPPSPYEPPIAAPAPGSPDATEPPAAPERPERPGPATAPPQPEAPEPAPPAPPPPVPPGEPPPPGPPTEVVPHCLHLDPILLDPEGCVERLLNP